MGLQKTWTALLICIAMLTAVEKVQSDTSSFTSPDSYTAPQLQSGQDQFSDNSGYAPPQPQTDYGSYGPPAQQYGVVQPQPAYGEPAPVYGPVKNSQPIEKYHFKAVLIAFKFMLLFILYILYQITYLGPYPSKASSNPIKRQFPTASITSFANKFVNKIIDGDFDVSDLFKNSR